MNKKIKSLLAGGLLVVGMGGNIFAAEQITGNDKDHQHKDFLELKIDSPKAGKTYDLQQVTVKISEDGKYATVTDKTTGDQNQDKIIVEKVHMKGGNALNCYDKSEGFNDLVCPNNGGDNIPGISHITIYLSQPNTDADGDGIPDFKDDEVPSKPDDDVKEPDTSDASMVGVAGLAVAAGVGLYAINKKDDEE